MRLSPYGKPQWVIVALIGVALAAVFAWWQIWWAVAAVAVVTLAALAFFRDPQRDVPVQRNIMVAPADGVVSSVHEVERYDLFDEPATCVRIFLSLLDVHVNRSPCHGVVGPIESKPGKFISATKPESAEVNTWVRFPLLHATKRRPVAAVRQVAGMIARHIVCGAKEGDTLQRGELFGMIKFGSTTELWVPASYAPVVKVKQGDRVRGGETVLMEITPPGDEREDEAIAAQAAEKIATAPAEVE